MGRMRRQTLGHAQHSRTRARIGSDFGRRWFGFTEKLELRLGQVNGTNRQAAVRLRQSGLACHELLDDTIFQ